MKTVCCFGHRKIENKDVLKQELFPVVEKLIVEDSAERFLFGSNSQFNDLCYDVVVSLKERYPQIRCIYVRAEYPYIDDSYKAYLLESYDDTYYPQGMENAGRASYVERNQFMINDSDICIVYYNENYLPPKRRISKNALTEYQAKSGTKIAYEYAIKKQKTVINLFK